MEPTLYGVNRTGAHAWSERVLAMEDAVQQLSPQTAIDTGAAQSERMVYLMESYALGSIARPESLRHDDRNEIAQLRGQRPELLLDKLGERLAFERSGVRLYDALILKHKAAAVAAAGPVLVPVGQALQAIGEPDDLPLALRNEDPLHTLARLRSEELMHFHLLCDAMQQMGADPSAQTPCADTGAMACAGLIQVVTDPRTTLAQSLNAMLTAELTDNAGWELLIALARKAGETQLCDAFSVALAQEARHLVAIRSWLTAMLVVDVTLAAF